MELFLPAGGVMKNRYSILAKSVLPCLLLVLAACAPAATVPGRGTAPGLATWTPLPANTLEQELASTSTATSTFELEWALTPTFTSTFTPTPGIIVTALAAGRRHTCIITARQSVKCWGENEDGQLGDGTTLQKFVPADVPGLAGVTALAAGFNHTCARTDLGDVYCWGNNAFGELGDGTQTSRPVPVRVPLPISATLVSAGSMHSCATNGREIYCWGVVEYEQMDGEDVVGIAFEPYYIDNANIPSSAQITAIDSGATHDCVLTSQGAVYCWGRNDLGQLGQGSIFFSNNIPERVDGLNSVKNLTVGGYHTCALLDDNSVACWGYNKYGQLGSAIPGEVDVPALVTGIGSAMDISAGAYHTCAIVSGGNVKCWGDNRYRQVSPQQTALGQIAEIPGNFRLLTAGGSHTCALTGGGSLVCWGNNKYGQLGESGEIPTPEPTAPAAGATEAASSTPLPTQGSSKQASSIAAGRSHSCAVTTAGGVRCWGKNEHGELGNGTFADSRTPVDVMGLSHGMKAVVAGWGHTCALTDSGGVKCWGYNKNGELGNGANENLNRPADVRGLTSGVISLEAADDHTCALLANGAVRCWGFNMYGQLGDGTSVNRNTPVDVTGLNGTIGALAAGWGHTCALSTAGGVKCWGNNEYGQLGVESKKETIHTPVIVSGLASGVTAIASDGGHACAITTRGLVMCWGNNKYGQLGDGTAEIRKLPVVVTGLTLKPAAIGAGWNHTCVTDGSGEMACWGWNYYGQLGNGIRTTSTTPVRSGELMSGAARFALGWGHMCVITDTGGAQCWGLNEFGQAGDGTIADSFLPTDVIGLMGG
jgi:alpha-tubulin suppressor-like RCC1 family protein